MALKDHYIIAIGASAGGLEAIHEFFDHMPQNEHLSFVIIQHLSPDYKSLLVELVSKHTHMKVYEAGNEMVIQKECIYVIPNNKTMTVRNGSLQLSEKKDSKSPNTAIDLFLNTLAEDRKDKAIAIILSGTGTDGTRGIKTIKECEGLVVVQDPATAKFDGMPQSAIASGYADLILSPEMMPEEIYNYIKETPVHVLNEGKIDEDLLEEVFRLVYNSSNFDFQFYKTPTIIRRIGRRMSQLGVGNLDGYVRYLGQNPQEARLLSKDFLINVTQFFRDRVAFELLSEKVLPRILEHKGPHDPLKVWICACSTGEEAYSMAIQIDRYLELTGTVADVKIFATDIDSANIEYASKNAYPLAIAKDIPPEILARYFIREGKTYSLIPHIRKQVVFARHNVIKDPPFIKNDLVSCRNMLIYMNSILQHKVLSTFHFALKDHGFLFLGPSETAGYIKQGIEEIDSKWKIYRKTGAIKNDHEVYRNVDGLRTGAEKRTPPAAKEGIAAKTEPGVNEFVKTLTEDLGYVSFYIDENYEIRETIGDFNRFLSLPDKKLNLNILKMVAPELSAALTPAIRKSRKEGKKILLKNVRVKQRNKDIFLQVIVKQVQLNNILTTLIVVGENGLIAGGTEPEAPAMRDQEHTSYVFELESELTETRRNLQLAIEGLETTNEELQSSNEELLSANEELQSSNEELQSLNEELHTLNTEHQLKIKELIDLNDDLNNYFRSTGIGQVFLDPNMRIRKFNPAAASLINLIDTDIGRPLNHISNNLQYEPLFNDARQVIDTGKLAEKELVLTDGNTVIMRIMPYLRKDKKTDGAVITFVDVTEIHELNNIVKGVFNASLSAIMALNAVHDEQNKIVDFAWVSLNYAAENLLGNGNDYLAGKSLKKHAADFVKPWVFEKLVKVVESGKPLQTELQVLYEETERWFEVTAVKMKEGLVTTFTEITARKLSDQKLKKNYNELITARESLKKLNAALEDKVKERTRELSENEERFRLVSQATNDTIWDWDIVMNKTWWSHNFQSAFGYPGNETSRSFWLSKVHPDDRGKVSGSLNDAINKNEKQWHAAYRFLKADGKYASVLDRAFILHDEFHTPYRMLGSMFDVTRLNEAEQKLRESELQATRLLLEKKDEFMSIASHELKTPITSMKASLQIVQRLAKNGQGNEKIQPFIDKANIQVSKLTGLVEDLLDVTKIQAGKMKLDKSLFRIGEAIRDSIDQVQYESAAHKVEVEGDTDLEVYADKHRLEQVIINFLSNAIKYSPGAEKVKLSVGYQNNSLKLAVTDFGIGIPGDKMAYVFDRFFRVQESSQKFSGLGLGLYISSGIIARHEGEIGVDSQEGKGTTFWFTIPYKAEADSQGPYPEANSLQH
ncbi:chemotaxis protein CheB [Hufsiella ginkgonis]|uniref:histidine kinase n=1 Tax=Hufsiella ginkgonis TaxID=2695274 RepID=A0A7K1Y100_9SPHI|nr:chemotaxis protein CheB [Hufsiella ginkgonis]MXV16923.1 PAS domain-containing protein [Hufsiella ginkgonis]